jgi:hypothetical protein
MLHEKSIKGGRKGPPVVGMASGGEEKKGGHRLRRDNTKKSTMRQKGRGFVLSAGGMPHVDVYASKNRGEGVLKGACLAAPGGEGKKRGKGGGGKVLSLKVSLAQHTPSGSADAMTASMLSATDRASKEGESVRRGGKEA